MWTGRRTNHCLMVEGGGLVDFMANGYLVIELWSHCNSRCRPPAYCRSSLKGGHGAGRGCRVRGGNRVCDSILTRHLGQHLASGGRRLCHVRCHLWIHADRPAGDSRAVVSSPTQERTRITVKGHVYSKQQEAQRFLGKNGNRNLVVAHVERFFCPSCGFLR